MRDETRNYSENFLPGRPLRPLRRADGTGVHPWHTAEKLLLEFKESEEYAEELAYLDMWDGERAAAV